LKRPLVLLLGLLVAAIVAELSYGTGHHKQRDQKTGQVVNVAPEATTNGAPPASSVDQWVAVALARPPFAPDRRPIGLMSGDAALPRLTGVIASPTDEVAIFQAAGNMKPVLVRHGETVASWEVTTIAGDTVSLRKAGDRLAIRLEFDNLKSIPVVKQATQPQSRWETAAETGLLRARWSNPQLQP
jgi:hypothetical protein